MKSIEEMLKDKIDETIKRCEEGSHKTGDLYDIIRWVQQGYLQRKLDKKNVD